LLMVVIVELYIGRLFDNGPNTDNFLY